MISSFKPVIESLTEECETLARAIELREKDLAERKQSVEHKEKGLAEMRAEYSIWLEAAEILIKIEERGDEAQQPRPIPVEPPDSVEKDAVKV